jgi:hypothetical protein
MVTSNILGWNVTHTIEVVFVPNNHGYPYAAECSCAWRSNTYASRHAAEQMGADHLATVAN